MKRIGFLIVLLAISLQSIAQELTVRKLYFEGLKKTKESTLRKMLDTEVNTPLDSTLLSTDIIRLKRMPAVAHAYFTVTPINESECEVKIGVEENFTLIPTLNLWTTTNRRLAYKVGLYEYNLLGRNLRVGGFYQHNGFDSYGVQFEAPTLFSRNFGLAFYHQSWKSEEPLYFDQASANYKYENISYELLGLFQINFRNTIAAGINLFKERYTYLSGHTAAQVPQRLDVNKKLLKFRYTYDDLDYFYHYVSGFKSQLYLQYVTTVNSYQKDFLIAWNDLFYFKRFGTRGNWANRLRVGLSSNIKSPFAPFALDNNVNLRGVGILVDRGTGSIVWNTEYRHTLIDKKWFALQTNVFTDIGSWRHPGGSLSDFVQAKNIHVYSGVGLRLINKKIFNAIFRIDYGYGLTANASRGFVFGIGQYF
ncbi:conserved hypothetical protein [Tenacibaculum litopenaei]|jgi:outer membrane protein assembly factor BamA|uniref:outer membrane protein assembly factor n=1 Tax=Tenacibaculum litopenaei TaxID=396016 RepID=UPI0038948553